MRGFHTAAPLNGPVLTAPVGNHPDRNEETT